MAVPASRHRRRRPARIDLFVGGSAPQQQYRPHGMRRTGVTPLLIVAPDTSEPVAYEQLKNAVDAKSTALFEVVGTVEKKGDVETIAIASVKESR